MDNQSKKIAAMGFASSFAGALSESLAAATGSAWRIAVANQTVTSAPKGAPIHIRLTLDGALSGECFIEFYEPQITTIVSQILKQPVTELTGDHSKTLTEAVSTAADALVLSLSSKYGKLSCKVEPVEGLAFGGTFVVPLEAPEQLADSQILLYFGSQLLQALSAAMEPSVSADAEEPAFSRRNLNLVMDVELNVLLRFGQRQLPLREVLELGSGSVIELDRMVDEPVELFLDGKLIARGEAVVVDGNYGLRVTEIPQPVATYFVN